MTHTTVSLYAGGDLHPNRTDPESLLALAAPTLHKADIVFGQLEENLSERGAPQMQMFPGSRAHPNNVRALTSAGVTIMSLAGNHTLDWGEEALLDTIDVLGQNQIKTVGAGRNISEARQPVIIEKKGTRIAFLAYCSVLPRGYEARADKSGCVPMRVSTFYEQVDWQPGTPPRTISLANKEDLEAMNADIRNVRPLADIVVMSIHWGIHFAPALIAMYQREVAHTAIDAGVDLILGHHAHILKAIEIYAGKVIFHSLGNFAFDAPIERMRRNIWPDYYGWKLDPEYTTFPFPPDSRKTMIAKCLICDNEIAQVSFLPGMINKQGQPEILSRSDKRSSEVLEYVDWCCRNQNINTKFSWEKDEVVISL